VWTHDTNLVSSTALLLDFSRVAEHKKKLSSAETLLTFIVRPFVEELNLLKEELNKCIVHTIKTNRKLPNLLNPTQAAPGPE
tara:strand:- start:6089 stop:6334 length:246 start_codon:yes stop_codon:yes gene_type:complete